MERVEMCQTDKHTAKCTWVWILTDLTDAHLGVKFLKTIL